MMELSKSNKTRNIYRITVFFIIIFCFTSCSHSLLEHEGAFAETLKIYFLEDENYCEHIFQYDLASNHTANLAYNSSEYHYVMCVNYGVDPLCKFAPVFEKHKAVDDYEMPPPVTLYNGRQYMMIYKKCEICNKNAGYKYVLFQKETD